jgi:hypothetical protein
MSVHLPCGFRIKFVSAMDYSMAMPASDHLLAEVHTGEEVVTYKWVSSMGMSPCLGIVMTDGDKAYFRHHVPGIRDGELAERLSAGFKCLNGEKPVHGLVIGGQDQSETRNLIQHVWSLRCRRNTKA